MNWFQGFIANNLMGFKLTDIPLFLFALFVSGTLAFILGKIRGTSNDLSFTHHLVVIAMGITLVVTTIRYSIPLSLAFIAVMMLVRFRSVLQDFKELTYVLLTICAGIGCGSGYTILTIIGFVPIFVVLMLSKRIK